MIKRGRPRTRPRGEYTLAEWLELEQMSQAELCRCTGLSKNAVSRYVRGVRFPAPYHCGLLFGFTKGEVTLEKMGEAVEAFRVGYCDGLDAGRVKSVTRYG